MLIIRKVFVVTVFITQNFQWCLNILRKDLLSPFKALFYIFRNLLWSLHNCGGKLVTGYLNCLVLFIIYCLLISPYICLSITKVAWVLTTVLCWLQSVCPVRHLCPMFWLSSVTRDVSLTTVPGPVCLHSSYMFLSYLPLQSSVNFFSSILLCSSVQTVSESHLCLKNKTDRGSQSSSYLVHRVFVSTCHVSGSATCHVSGSVTCLVGVGGSVSRSGLVARAGESLSSLVSSSLSSSWSSPGGSVVDLAPQAELVRLKPLDPLPQIRDLWVQWLLLFRQLNLKNNKLYNRYQQTTSEPA